MNKGVYIKDMFFPSACIFCEFGRFWTNDSAFCTRYPAHEARSIMAKRPDWCPLTADVRPVVHAHWEIDCKFEDSVYARCTNCKVVQIFYYGKPLTNYCPHCGAIMDKEGVDSNVC